MTNRLWWSWAIRRILAFRRTAANDADGALTFIGKLIEDYKQVDGQPLGERKHWFQDDYVKFIRFARVAH